MHHKDDLRVQSEADLVKFKFCQPEMSYVQLVISVVNCELYSDIITNR